MTRKLYLALVFPAFLAAQAPSGDRPLTALPYTPSLEPAFMDRSVDPCVDFFQYACGNWIKTNPIPADQPRWDVYAKMGNDNQRFLWGLLEQAAQPSPGRTPSQQKIGDYFAACMDQSAIEKAAAAPLGEMLDEIASLKSVAGLPPVLARLNLESPASALFAFDSNQDFADSSQVIAFAGAGGLGLPDRDYYLKTDPKSQETRAHYLDHVTRMFQLLGDSAAASKSEARTVMEMETALAAASLTRVEKRDPYKLFHKMERPQFLAATPSFAWAGYWSGIGLPAPAQVNVTEPAFFQEVEKQLKTRPIADWKVYLRWHLVHARAPYLSSPFVQANFDFYSHYLRGVTEMQPRWKRCVRYVDRDLGEALGQVFAAQTFSGDTKQRALEMTREIQKAMEADIRRLSWMGDATKDQALVKLHGMIDKIGYPDHWRDYSTVRIQRGDFAGDVGRAMEFETRRQLAKIGKPVDHAEWQMTPPTVNAYYDPQMNDINFPAGVLQPPLYDPKMDDAPNYGNTGATIGHELTHGFDDEGRQFDAKGNLRDWWTEKDAAEFVKRSACIADQYAQYTVVDDIKINSRLTLGEDAADLGGTILAYMAWKDAARGQDLPSTGGFTPDQRFFIGMAQWACGDERPESKRLNAVTNPHSPNQYRIDGVVSNMPEFGAAFSCQAGRPMVHVPACRVW